MLVERKACFDVANAFLIDWSKLTWPISSLKSSPEFLKNGFFGNKVLGVNGYERYTPRGLIPRISSDGDDRRIFWVLNFNSGIVLGTKIWQVFFWVAGFKQGFFGVLKGIGSALAT